MLFHSEIAYVITISALKAFMLSYIPRGASSDVAKPIRSNDEN